MNPIQLFHADGKPASDIHYCEKCRIVHPSRDAAERCCVPPKCEDCGAGAEKYYTVCHVCRTARQAKREAERFAKAEKVTEWSGPVYLEGLSGDGYVADTNDLEDVLSEHAEEFGTRPEYVWTCCGKPFAQLDIRKITEGISENAYEEWDGDLEGLEELKKAIDAFNEANKELVSWEPDFKRALLIGSKAKS